MNIWRAIGVSVCTLIFSTTLTLFILSFTLTHTLLNKTTLNHWLNQSKVYQNAASAIANSTTIEVGNNASSSFMTSSLREAITQTFNANYIQQATTSIVNGAYNWLGGSASSPQFSIPLDTQTQNLTTNLTRVLTTRLSTLPPCNPSSQVFDPNNPTCLPLGMDPNGLASNLSQQTVSDLNLPQTPVTQSNLLGHSGGQLSSWSGIAKKANLWQWVLLLTAVVCGGVVVLISKDHLRSSQKLASKAFFIGLTYIILGSVMWYIGAHISFSNFFTSQSQSIATGILDPLVHTILPGIAKYLLLISGIITLFSGGTWLAFHYLRKNRLKRELTSFKTIAERPGVPQPQTPPTS